MYKRSFNFAIVYNVNILSMKKRSEMFCLITVRHFRLLSTLNEEQSGLSKINLQIVSIIEHSDYFSYFSKYKSVAWWRDILT